MRVMRSFNLEEHAIFSSLRLHLGTSLDADAWHARFPWMSFGLGELRSEVAYNQNPFDDKCNIEVSHSYDPKTFWTMTSLTIVLKECTQRRQKC